MTMAFLGERFSLGINILKSLWVPLVMFLISCENRSVTTVCKAVSSTKGTTSVWDLAGHYKDEMFPQSQTKTWDSTKKSENCSSCEYSFWFHFRCVIFNLLHSGKPDIMLVKISCTAAWPFFTVISGYNALKRFSLMDCWLFPWGHRFLDT